VDWNQDGTLNPVPSNLDEVVAIAASWGHSVALRRGGTVVAWGEAIGDAASLVDSMTNVVAISATPMGIQALLADGSLLNVKLGTNAEIERRGGPTDSMRFVQVFPGWDGGGATEYYGMRADGRLWSVSGTGFPSEVSGNSPVRSISSNTFHSLALHRDGSVTAWGNSDYVNLTVPEGLGRIAQVAAAHRFSALLLDRSEPSEGVLPKAAMVDFPDGRYRIGLYDLLGNLVWSGEAVRTRQVWDMPFNRPGTWVVRTRTSSGWRSEKIVRLR
jgi:hypothetical protein